MDRLMPRTVNVVVPLLPWGGMGLGQQCTSVETVLRSFCFAVSKNKWIRLVPLIGAAECQKFLDAGLRGVDPCIVDSTCSLADALQKALAGRDSGELVHIVTEPLVVMPDFYPGITLRMVYEGETTVGCSVLDLRNNDVVLRTSDNPVPSQLITRLWIVREFGLDKANGVETWAESIVTAYGSWWLDSTLGVLID